jgi:hypothetical protein
MTMTMTEARISSPSKSISRLRHEALAPLVKILHEELAVAVLDVLVGDPEIADRASLVAASSDIDALGPVLFRETSHRVAWSHVAGGHRLQLARSLAGLRQTAATLQSLYRDRWLEVRQVASVIVGSVATEVETDLLSVLLEAALRLGDADPGDWSAHAELHLLDLAERARRADSLLRLGRDLGAGDVESSLAAEQIDDELRRIVVDLRRISAPVALWETLQELLLMDPGRRWSLILQLARHYARFRGKP